MLDDGVIRSAGDTILGGDDKADSGHPGSVAGDQERNLSHPPLEVIFTVSEEQGLMGSKHLDSAG